MWACRFNPFKPSQFAAGDEVNSVYLYEEGKLIAKNSKAHQQGICDLVYADEWLLYSGGFDGFICAYDTRKFDVCLKQSNWGGTIWRIMPHKKLDRLLICNSS